jgi:hypothetical protein
VVRLVLDESALLELGSESRDKFMASGQQVAVKGTVLGYYLFKRCEPNKREMEMPWEIPETESPRDLEPGAARLPNEPRVSQRPFPS